MVEKSKLYIFWNTSTLKTTNIPVELQDKKDVEERSRLYITGENFSTQIYLPNTCTTGSN